MTELFEDYYNYEFKQNYKDLEDQYDFLNKQLTENKNKINFVVTHGSCSDGFMSSTIVWKWLKENNVDVSQVTFFDAHHGNNFNKLPELMKDKYVLICDFSFNSELFERMIETTKGNILVLDHHKTAQQELSKINKKYVTFDMNHSGAFITWMYMYGFNLPVPKAVLYVEDNDIWLKKLPYTREYKAMLFLQSFTFEELLFCLQFFYNRIYNYICHFVICHFVICHFAFFTSCF